LALSYIARFRIKKKQKNLNLERTVSDLTSRAEELEREATNLRRENSWLKEMVIMKGKRNLSGIRRPYDEKSAGDQRGKSDDESSEGSDLDYAERARSERAKIKGKGKPDDSGEGKFKGKEERRRS
jgi:hypothetical protein